MRIKLCIVLLIMLSFINTNCFGMNNNIFFEKIEEDFRIESNFIENGAKLQYTTNNTMRVENEKIKKMFNEYKCVENDKNSIDNLDFYKGKQKVSAYLWYEGKELYVEIVMNNKDEELSTNDQYCLLSKLEDGNVTSKQYYYYYKGKIEKSVLNKMIEKEQMEKVNILKINNGYTGVAVLNKEKINFAEVHYNTGSYIIIASPVIFTTY